MDALKVICEEEYNKGYACNPSVDLGSNRIIYDIKPFVLVRKINDKKYIVKDPNGY